MDFSVPSVSPPTSGTASGGVDARLRAAQVRPHGAAQQPQEEHAGKVKAGVPIEPLILRAKPGECLKVTLKNNLPAGQQFDLPGFNTMPMIVEGFNANDVKPSANVGLHPQSHFFDVTRSNGVNVSQNPVQTAAPGQYCTDVCTSTQ